ncbi:MAG: DNA polymerase III subunit gamma/tau, partial [Caldisericia bacterium]|nr:DNA polymerase III subunit gamma/tau [Caldisericia bacterium]
MHTTLYRKWRPKIFDEVIGQDDIVRVLKNEIKLNKISHAYLFCGPRGTGKTSCARILARSANCIEGPTIYPCGKCHLCKSISNGVSYDVIEIDAASNRGIDNIRELREKVRLAPVECTYKIYIIDEVHMLTGEAFNALLKTLEEPPQNTIFIMATTESHKLPKTIISRCQRFDFKRISSIDIAKKLQKEIEAEKINIQPDAIKIISESCDGAMRDAESILDQLSVLSDNENPITEDNVLSLLGKSSAKNLYTIIHNLFFGDYPSLVTSLENLAQSGTDILLYTQDILSYCRDIIIMAETDGKSSFFSIIPENDNDIFFEQAKRIQIGYLIKLTVMLSNVLPSMKFLTRPQLLLETTLLQLRYLVDHPVSKRKKLNNHHTIAKKDSTHNKSASISQTSKTL